MSMLQQLICSPNGISKASVNYSEMNEDHERQIVAFGCADDFGYDPEFPIRCICVRPKQQKFAENLSHRDFLGALMNLGIERETIGDIIIQDNVGYIMCLDTVASYLMSSILKIRKTSVVCSLVSECPSVGDEMVNISIQVSSERLDAVISKVYKVSRKESGSLFVQKKVFINGRQCENHSVTPQTGDLITVRGFGRFRYGELERVTQKGNLVLNVSINK